MNAHKARRIEPFLPLPNPHDPTLAVRILYERGFFVCNSNDAEATNLIEFLGLNRPEVCAERRGQVQRLRRMQSCFADSPDAFTEVLLESPENLSFPSALEAELGIPAMDLIRRLPTEGLSEANP